MYPLRSQALCLVPLEDLLSDWVPAAGQAPGNHRARMERAKPAHWRQRRRSRVSSGDLGRILGHVGKGLASGSVETQEGGALSRGTRQRWARDSRARPKSVSFGQVYGGVGNGDGSWAFLTLAYKMWQVNETLTKNCWIPKYHFLGLYKKICTLKSYVYVYTSCIMAS